MSLRLDHCLVGSENINSIIASCTSEPCSFLTDNQILITFKVSCFTKRREKKKKKEEKKEKTEEFYYFFFFFNFRNLHFFVGWRIFYQIFPLYSMFFASFCWGKKISIYFFKIKNKKTMFFFEIYKFMLFLHLLICSFIYLYIFLFSFFSITFFLLLFQTVYWLMLNR